MSEEIVKKTSWLERQRIGATAALDVLDEQGAKFLKEQAEKQEGRIQKYMRVVGAILFLVAVSCVFTSEYLYAFIAFCTLHLQIVMNYRLKKETGTPQWKNT